jgi:hypothetical protein
MIEIIQTQTFMPVGKKSTRRQRMERFLQQIHPVYVKKATAVDKNSDFNTIFRQAIIRLFYNGIGFLFFSFKDHGHFITKQIFQLFGLRVSGHNEGLRSERNRQLMC